MSLEMMMDGQRRMTTLVFICLLVTLWSSAGRCLSLSEDNPKCFGTCSGNNSYTERKSNSCRCDESCQLYGDCCLDARINGKENEEEISRWNCRTIPTRQERLTIFVIGKCPISWDNTRIKEMCENETAIEDDPFLS